MGLLRRACVLCLLGGLSLLGCSNGSGSLQAPEEQQGSPPPTPPPAAGFSIGGSVAGLSGSGLVLQLNGSGNLPVAGDGAFVFAGLLPDGTAYAVTVASQPT